MIGFLLILVVLAGVGYLVYRNRPHTTIESGIRSFRREMRALAPPPQGGDWLEPLPDSSDSPAADEPVDDVDPTHRPDDGID